MEYGYVIIASSTPCQPPSPSRSFPPPPTSSASHHLVVLVVLLSSHRIVGNIAKISSFEEDYRADRPMVQRASSSDAPSVQGGQHRESRFGLGYPSYQSGYNKLFTQVPQTIKHPGVGDPNPCSLMRFSNKCHGFCNLIYSKTFNLKFDLKIPLT